MYPNDPTKILRAADAGAGAGGAGDSAGGAAAPAGGGTGQPAGTGAVPGAGDPYAVVAGVKPAGLPEKFWNGEAKAVRLPELMRSYAEAESLIGRRAAEMSEPDFQRLVETRVSGMTKELEAKALTNIRGAAPKEPKDYQIQLSNEALQKLPEFMRELSQYESDPLVGWFRGFAHEVGLGPAQFQKAFEGYLAQTAEAQSASVASEQSKLGTNGQKRMDTLSNFLDANLEKRQAQALRGSLSSAEAFAAVEALVAKLADPSVIRGFSEGLGVGQTGPGLASEAEIRAAQRDPRYWDPAKRDPAYVKGIQAAWERLTAQGTQKR